MNPFEVNLAQCGREAIRMSPYALVGFFLGAVVVFSSRMRARRRKQKQGVIRARLAIQAEARREASRAMLSTYQAPIRALSEFVGRDPGDIWSRFSEAFLVSGNIDAGLLAAFGGELYFARFDWRDLDEFQGLAARAHHFCAEARPFVFDPSGPEASVELGVRLLGQWLEAEDFALLFFGADSDAYSVFILRRERALEVVALCSGVKGLQVELLH